MGTKTANKIERARREGRKGWELRHVTRNPYKSGTDLHEAWNEGRDEARREGERPEVIEEVKPVETPADRLKKLFGGAATVVEIEE